MYYLKDKVYFFYDWNESKDTNKVELTIKHFYEIF